ncbi:cysteine synthase A [Pseudovibrio ascidiaceicola]|uniref:Cysteine synthase A n=1 Tax=Pseudovibrio ascidiaceicola TaxID=285279 RepID=A0A1I3X0H3_9HYPH|nr:hypothetical protein [Pseudovibrio ascidiaceicola]SFK13135.1 cysteine synthase A [Pseudovibrio ascidiaceicola]
MQSLEMSRWLKSLILRKRGGSTGANLYGVLALAKKMMECDQGGSVLICDSGERQLNIL